MFKRSGSLGKVIDWIDDQGRILNQFIDNMPALLVREGQRRGAGSLKKATFTRWPI